MSKNINCDHVIAFHVGHNTYTRKEYEKVKKEDDLDCCGGTVLLAYCPNCGSKLAKVEQ